MARRAARVDRNQAEIVRALRSIGASVAVTSNVGDGFGDLVAGLRGKNFLLECKDPKKPLCERRLTPAQEEFHRSWAGQIAVVETVEEAIAVVMNGES